MERSKMLASVLLKILVGSLVMSSMAFADVTKKTKKAVDNNPGKAKLGTSFHFDGSSLHGKYQTSPSTTATVENDKYLEDLLGARQNFDDRIARDGVRN